MAKKRNNKHKIIPKIIKHPDFLIKDLVQIIIGATVLAIPVGFTEEVWILGENLSMINVGLLMLISLLFISAFVFYTYHKQHNEPKWDEFLKRTLSTYIGSFIVVAILMTIIDKAPWSVDFMLAFKRVSIVTFPSSMSAAVADLL